MTKAEAINNIREFFEDDEDLFNECIEDLDNYNGWLDNRRCYPMDELDELYCTCSHIEVLERAFFGHDDETWHTDSHGEKEYGAFNPNREYFYYNGYGNLVSCDEKDYSDFLDDHAIESMAEHRREIYQIGENAELKELFDAYEEAED